MGHAASGAGDLSVQGNKYSRTHDNLLRSRDQISHVRHVISMVRRGRVVSISVLSHLCPGGIEVVAGGLRGCASGGSLVVTRRGGGSKDTWVLAK